MKRINKAKQENLIEFVRSQVGIDLNEYRDGVEHSYDCSTTRYYDFKDYVAINSKKISQTEFYGLLLLQAANLIELLDCGAWIKLVRKI